MSDKPNMSAAVRAQRKVSARSIDYCPTPPYATRLLMEWLVDQGIDLASKVCLEPAAGGGHMVSVLEEYFELVVGSDLYDPENKGWPRFDFSEELSPLVTESPDWIITNPPFNKMDQFIWRAIKKARVGCAILARIQILEGISRYQDIYSNNPPTDVLVFTERVPMTQGKIDMSVSSAMCFSWFVWTDVENTYKPRIDWLRK